MTAAGNTAIRLRRALRHMTPQHVVRSRLARRVVERFTEKVGLVYFGAVDQREDDYKRVRGHTVSATNLDTDYSVGTVHGYDVVLLHRNDVLRAKDRKDQRCHWLIIAVDLHLGADIPHCYVGHRTRESAFAATYTSLKRLPLGHLHTYPAQFLDTYSVYSQLEHALDVERLINPELASVIASHFQGASVEIEDGTVYVYVDSRYPSEPLLERALSNALWLAERLDTALLPQEKSA